MSTDVFCIVFCYYTLISFFFFRLSTWEFVNSKNHVINDLESRSCNRPLSLHPGLKPFISIISFLFVIWQTIFYNGKGCHHVWWNFIIYSKCGRGLILANKHLFQFSTMTCLNVFLVSLHQSELEQFQPTFTYSKLTTETLSEGVKYV